MNLSIHFANEDYDQELALNEGGRCLFKGYADHLIQGEATQLNANLNFGGSTDFVHGVRLSGANFVLLPLIEDADIRNYLNVTDGRPIVISRPDMEKLWTALRYPFDELDSIAELAAGDVRRLWFLSSNLKSASSFKCFNLEISGSLLSEEPQLPMLLTEFMDRIEGASFRAIQKMHNEEGCVVACLDADGVLVDWSYRTLQGENLAIGAWIAPVSKR